MQTAPPDKTPPVQEAWAGRPAFRTSPSILEPARPEIYNFRFASDRKFKEKFERLAEVLGVENPLQHMAVNPKKKILSGRDSLGRAES